MNEFRLYEQLCVLESIANQYPNGKAYGKRIRQIADRIVSRIYRVAVIGEFKRGKSSLVNAIIGAQVLPTDILPMTATLTRVTYGEKRRILIQFKDGREEERTVAELVDFATKLDAEKEKTAAQIREIQVSYPSVFCKNHIDIIDTPGLNDNEAMRDVTLGVLENIDAAMMVISAKAPLSMTEQSLILNMIGKQQIRHIIFVVTHIDAVSSRPREQDRMIEFIGNRLRTELLDQANRRWAEDPYYREKAHRILSQPDIFGVSSVLAMDGFIHDDEQLLEQSRFPYFKNELFALLTAAQSEDVRVQTMEAIASAYHLFPEWVSDAITGLDGQKNRLLQKRENYVNYINRAEPALADCFGRTQGVWRSYGLGSNGFRNPHLTKALRRGFIQQLGQIREHNNTDDSIRAALLTGAEEARRFMLENQPHLLDTVAGEMAQFETWLVQARQNGGLAPIGQTLAPAEVPGFFLTDQAVLPRDGVLKGRDVMPQVSRALDAALEIYGQEITAYVLEWRMALYRLIKADQANHSIPDQINSELEAVTAQRNVLEVNQSQNRQKLAELMAEQEKVIE